MRMRLSRRASRLLVSALALMLLGCNTGTYPIDYFPEMHYQPSKGRLEPNRLAPREGAIPFRGTRLPRGSYAPGDVAFREQLPPEIDLEPPLTFVEATDVPNPLPRTPEVLEVGREAYRVHCAMCHGSDGDADTPVAAYFLRSALAPYPPVPFDIPRVRERTDGQLFWILTNGLGNMPYYGDLLTAEQRWALVYVIRELQER